MDPEEAVRQVIWDLDNDEHTDAVLGLNDYAQWVSAGGFPASGEVLDGMNTAANGWADRWDDNGGWS